MNVADPGRLDGRVALVTGAAGGLGAAVVTSLASRGARVVGADLDPTAVAAAEAVTAAHLDVRDGAQWRAVVDGLLDREGRFDLLVNCAGVYRKGPLADWSDEAIGLLLDVNLLGTIYGVREAARAMSDGGAVVNVASTAGLSGHPDALVYSATKFGVRGVTRSAALELAGRRIRVNAVCPGPIDTPMIAAGDLDWSHVPLARAAGPAEVATLIAFLASDAAGFCTGGDYTADGGLSA